MDLPEDGAVERNAAVICPYCRSELGSAALRCSGCGTAHHESCWNENGRRCTVFRCESGQTLASPMPPRLAWIVEGALLAAPVLVFLVAFAGRWVF